MVELVHYEDNENMRKMDMGDLWVKAELTERGKRKEKSTKRERRAILKGIHG